MEKLGGGGGSLFSKRVKGMVKGVGQVGDKVGGWGGFCVQERGKMGLGWG